MKLFLNNVPASLSNKMRSLGYHPDRKQKQGSKSYSKRIGAMDYPKFHIYHNEGTTYLTLHIDMKQPSYGGTHAHAGEYSEKDNQWLKEESARITKELVNSDYAPNKTP